MSHEDFPLGGATVLVTGGHGFLGRHVVEALHTAGAARVVAPCREEADLRERDAVRKLIADERPDIVIHLAAVVGGIGANRAEPGRFFYENAVMGMELLEACRLGGVAKVVNVGTVCSYPKALPVPFREEQFWDGYPEESNAAYGIAKKAVLEMGRAYRAQYGMPVIGVLPVNLYGPGDRSGAETSHVIPGLVRRFVIATDRGATSVSLWGTGNATREFLHVRDAARGIVLATAHYDGAGPVNLGSGREISIATLAGEIADLVGYRGAIHWDTSRPDGQPRRLVDSTKAREQFGFVAEIPFAIGLAETVASLSAEIRRETTGDAP